MKQSHTVVLERLKEIQSDFDTEPYEVAWADEAILFLQLDQVTGSGVAVTASIQLSVDGINWVDEGSRLGPIDRDGLSFVRVSHFGGWLRAHFHVKGASGPVILTTQLVLKG